MRINKFVSEYSVTQDAIRHYLESCLLVPEKDGNQCDIKEDDCYDKVQIRDTFGDKVNRSARLINQKLVRNFRESGLEVTAEQWKILLYLYREDGQAQVSLAESTGKDVAVISRIIDTLEKHGLVFRARHPGDRRTNLVYLTENGWNIKEKLMSIGEKINSDITQGLALAEVEVFMRVLDKVINNTSQNNDLWMAHGRSDE